MEKTKILLVDDEVDFVEALAARLRNRGLEVEVATGGEEAIAKVKSTSFLVVVLDYAMPGLDGIETIKALREHDASIQFILLSGQATIKAALDASRLGAVDVLEKPTDIATLIDKIRQAAA
jgi:DNA-binding NtrC family response regulator